MQDMITKEDGFETKVIYLEGDVNMQDQEYVIKGSVDGMIKILQEDFSMPYDEAKFFVYVLVNQYNTETVNSINKDELNLWYLTEEDKYEGEIFNTHLVIKFSVAINKLYHKVFRFLVKWLFRREIDLVLIGMDLVDVIASSISKISDPDYCIYARIVELCIGNKEKLFDKGDIKTANRDGKCDYQEEDWKCTHLGQEENCSCNKEKLELTFLRLEEQNVIRKVGNRWMLVW